MTDFRVGQFEDICDRIRHEVEAEAVILVVYNSVRGSGYSIRYDQAEFRDVLPSILRILAAQLEEEPGSGHVQVQ